MDNQTSTQSQASFDHECTPANLSMLNQQLGTSLHETLIDEATLQKIIIERANLVESLLNNLDEQQKKRFATLELKVNDAILALVDEQKNHAKNALGKVSKASKAIKKYQQV